MGRQMARHFHESQTDPCAHETGAWQDAEPTGSSAVLTVVYVAAFIVLSYAVVIWLIGMLGQ